MASTRVSELSIEVIKRLLSEQSWSPPVYAWRVESDLDSVGEPALWVWAVYEAPEVDLEAARRAEAGFAKQSQMLVMIAGSLSTFGLVMNSKKKMWRKMMKELIKITALRVRVILNDTSSSAKPKKAA